MMTGEEDTKCFCMNAPCVWRFSLPLAWRVRERSNTSHLRFEIPSNNWSVMRTQNADDFLKTSLPLKCHLKTNGGETVYCGDSSIVLDKAMNFRSEVEVGLC